MRSLLRVLGTHIIITSFFIRLRVHPREDQAGVAQAISPILVKLGRFEGVHPKLVHSKFKEIWSKPGGDDHPPCFFFFTQMTKSHLKIGRKYKALLLKEFNQIFSYFQ